MVHHNSFGPILDFNVPVFGGETVCLAPVSDLRREAEKKIGLLDILTSASTSNPKPTSNLPQNIQHESAHCCDSPVLPYGAQGHFGAAAHYIHHLACALARVMPLHFRDALAEAHSTHLDAETTS